jgi:hypothetical protein
MIPEQTTQFFAQLAETGTRAICINCGATSLPVLMQFSYSYDFSLRKALTPLDLGVCTGGSETPTDLYCMLLKGKELWLRGGFELQVHIDSM